MVTIGMPKLNTNVQQMKNDIKLNNHEQYTLEYENSTNRNFQNVFVAIFQISKIVQI